MDSTLSDHNIQNVWDLFHWTQSFIYIDSDESVEVNLAEAVGENAKVPSDAPDHPEQYFKGSEFWFPGFVGSNSTTVKEVKMFFFACEDTILSIAQSIKSY